MQAVVLTQYSVCTLLLYPYGQLPVSQLSPCRGEVSAEELVSGRWEQSAATLSWAEMDAEERASPASEGHRLSARKQRLLEQETQPNRTWKPRAAMTHDGHKRRKRRFLPLLSSHEEDENGGKERWWLNRSGPQLKPCNVWSLMLPEMF